MKKNRLYRFMTGLAVTGLMLSLAACGKAGAAASTPEMTASEQTVAYQDANKGADAEASAEETMPASESGTPETPDKPESTASADIPSEDEIYDGIFGAMLLDSGKDLIGTTDDVGRLYAVIYRGEFTDEGFILYGSMDSRNDAAQDPIAVSDELAHVFHTDENTVYSMVGGEDGPEEISREDFIANFENCIKVGMRLDVTVKDGVVSQVSISA